MIIPADDEMNFPRNGGFKKFIIFWVVFDKSDFFFGDDKFRKLIDVMSDLVYGFLLQSEFWAVENFKIFTDHVGGNNNGKFLFVPFL